MRGSPSICSTRLSAPSLGKVQIPAAVLRERLDEALHDAAEGALTFGFRDEESTAEALGDYRDFVALCEDKERLTGEPVTISVGF
jgi:hypothetical protein